MSCFRIPVDIEARRMWKSVQRLSGENVWAHLPFCQSTQAFSVLSVYSQPWVELRVAGLAWATKCAFISGFVHETYLGSKNSCPSKLYKKLLIFPTFCKPSFLNRGSRPTWHDLHWRRSPRTAEDSPHPQVLLSLWILPGAQKYKEGNLWAHAGIFLQKNFFICRLLRLFLHNCFVDLSRQIWRWWLKT